MSKFIDHLQEVKKRYNVVDLHFFSYYLDGRYIHACSLDANPDIIKNDYKADLMPITKSSHLEEILEPFSYYPLIPCSKTNQLYLIETQQFYNNIEDLRKDAMILVIAGVS